MAEDRDYAERFALEHAHYEEDLPFWRAAAHRLGGPVLDVGCATGRVALPLAEAGHEVHVVDTSDAMLDVLERRAVEAGLAEHVVAHRADMRSMDLGRRFRLVIVPMNTFQLMYDEPDQLGALRTLARHTAADGELIIEVARPDFDEVEAMLGVLMPAGSYRDHESGRLLMHSTRYDHLDRERRRARFTLRIDETGPGGPRTVERRFDVRLFAQDELPALARRAGLRLIADHGGFGGELRGAGSEVQVLRFEVIG